MNNQLQAVLADLAAKFGITVEHLWGVMLRQASISAVTDIFTTLVFVAVTVIAYKVIAPKIAKSDGDSFFLEVMAPVLLTIAACLSVVAVIGMINNAATALLNPEYWALSKILSTLK